jgi:hypothetical protein
LQQAGVVRYSRGHIAVLDRRRLEQRTCECYAVAKKEYDRLLPKRTLLPTAVLMPKPVRKPLPRPMPKPLPGPMPMPMPVQFAT